MKSLTKRSLTGTQLAVLLRESAGIGRTMEAELTDGWFNAACRVLLDDGRPAVVKIASPPDAAVLRHERDIMATEVMAHRRMAALGGAPPPALLYAAPEAWPCRCCPAPPGTRPRFGTGRGACRVRPSAVTSSKAHPYWRVVKPGPPPSV